MSSYFSSFFHQNGSKHHCSLLNIEERDKLTMLFACAFAGFCFVVVAEEFASTALQLEIYCGNSEDTLAKLQILK